MSKVEYFEQFAQRMIESEDCDLEEIGEELMYFVNEWKKEINYEEKSEDRFDEAGLLVIPKTLLE